MEKKVFAESPARVAGLTIIPVVESRISFLQEKEGLYLWGSKEPLAVILISKNSQKVYRLNGEEIYEVSIEDLAKDYPPIKDEIQYNR